MTLKAFRVQMYKCILDSGWIEVDPLTVLVGKNDSGKTTLLKALHKLNPFNPEPYSMEREWPRGRRKERKDSHVVCTARFELSEEEIQELAKLTDQKITENTVEVTRNYAGRLEVLFSSGLFPNNLHPNDIDTTAPSTQKKAHEYIVNHIPTFIYMSDYHIFSGTAQLDQVKQRKERNQLTEEDKTLLTIMELAGLNLEGEVQKANLSDREQRQYDLDDASATLTRAISDRWKQRRYEVQFRADGQLFYTFVKDERDPSLIRLEERSKGFQWFFSFDLMFAYESKETFKNCVVLLDEPGLHLHPDAQRDLLKRMEDYTRENTLIYTTHLPFMIDLQKPERIRVLSETDNGTIVNDDLTQSQPEAKLILQAALAMSGSSSYLVAQRNLVVEGVDDFWLLTEISRLMKSAGKDSLPDDLFIISAGGASEAVYIAAFMIGQKLDVVVLLDSNGTGQGAEDRLIKKWLAKYQSNRARVLALDECLDMKDKGLSIEDIFPEKFYLEKVQEVYKKQLVSVGCEKLDLFGNGPICKRVERSLEKYGIKFNKGSVAKVIRSDLSQMQSVNELPSKTIETARKLIATINVAMPQEI